MIGKLRSTNYVFSGKIKLFAAISFSLYLLVLFYLLFFSAYRRGVKGSIDYNIIPFQSIYQYVSGFEKFGLHLLTDNFFGNMLAFVPLGLLLPILFSRMRSSRIVTIFSSLLSVSVETAQLIARVGAFDVDDILLNTVGGIIGYMIFRVLLKSFIKLDN
ncbi:VanZ family protein [Aquibacillus kalidii]|uniref:VanZ family protein n=1 Tax=Aquibacillus kalidii TaxID=2762597 RepID=UPI00164486A2|nr:VanZ family protein [Aquibacillus kalidii]